MSRQTPDTEQKRRLGVRIAVFASLVLLCAVVALVVLARSGSDDPKKGKSQELSVVPGPRQLPKLMQEPHVLFQNTDLGADYSKVEVVPRTDPRGARTVTPLTCSRVAMENGIGVCLFTDAGVVNHYKGEIFDQNFKVIHSFQLVGLPSRTRLSPNGHWAAMTVFVSGDSYASAGFSTRTTFVDTSTGKSTVNLERFDVTDNGAPVTNPRRNYWGVTFESDNDHSFATLGIDQKTWLIEGSVSSRSAHTVRTSMECPSLSPDQTRIAYKKRIGGTTTAIKWRLHVYNLQTGADVAIAETRSVDDQVEWLDDHTLLYSLPRSPTGTVIKDTYEVPADGTGHPELFIKASWSPAVGP